MHVIFPGRIVLIVCYAPRSPCAPRRTTTVNPLIESLTGHLRVVVASDIKLTILGLSKELLSLSLSLGIVSSIRGGRDSAGPVPAAFPHPYHLPGISSSPPPEPLIKKHVALRRHTHTLTCPGRCGGGEREREKKDQVRMNARGTHSKQAAKMSR